MIHTVTIAELLSTHAQLPLMDVRAPSEFSHGHIPGARNLPIFNDAERAQVGTTYKQAGHDAAVLLGFDLTGPKWSSFIREALTHAPGMKIALHCWRGGMRSSAMAWALNFYGFDVYLLQGGYKSFRNWTLAQFEKTYRLRLVGGMTGSGKTPILQTMARQGAQCIDLEAIAQHRGSSYGSMNRMEQPTQEQFENDLAFHLSQLNEHQTIWMEDESSSIGKCILPRALWKQMLGAELVNISVPFNERIAALVAEYGCLDKDFLIESTLRIRKRLGPEQTQHAVAAIRENRMHDFVKQVLHYYDKTYRTGLNSRPENSVVSMNFDSIDAQKNAALILKTMAQHEQH